MIVENHDNEVFGDQNSLLGLVGHNGTVDYPYQAEMWGQELLTHDDTRRIFVHDTRTVYVVWARNTDGNTSCVGRSPEWSGEWQLPNLYEGRSSIATISLGSEDYADADKMKAVRVWAIGQLENPAIAIALALDSNGVVVAWENANDSIIQVSKGPRPFD